LTVGALGITQILAWGSSYYLPAVLAPSIAREMGWPLSWVIGGLSLGLLVSGLVSPLVGRGIHRHGGRSILAASSVMLGLGLGCIGLAQNAGTYFGGWLMIGIGMGAGLYDAAFATLGRHYGLRARRLIGILTLFGGLASTVCWPLSAFLLTAVGWRGACFVYAGLQVFVSLPLLLIAMPRAARPIAEEVAEARSRGGGGVVGRSDLPLFVMLAVTFTLIEAVTSVVSVHLLTILQTRGIEFASAVALGALIGPAQVAARAVEIAFGRRYHPIWTLVAATVLAAAGLGWLLAGPSLPAMALVLYGAGIGISSIARGSVPLALFGTANYAVLMGVLAFPSLVMQAIAPWVGAQLLERGGAKATISALAGIAAVNLFLSLLVWTRVKARGAVGAG
jgi:hypothetical protein